MPQPPFCPMNRNLGPHNLLVDDDSYIIGAVDMDGIMAAPYEVAAQFPILAGLDPEPPGHVETKPLSLALERIKKTEPLIREYSDMVQEIEKRINLTGRKSGNVMLSEVARVVQGLGQYKGQPVACQ